MFRKRDNDPFESDRGTGQDPKVGTETKPETKSDARPRPDVRSEPEIRSEPDVRPKPDVRAEPEGLDKPEMAVATPHNPPSTNPPSELDLPESQPLSAAPKSAAASISPAAASKPEGNKRLIVGQGIRLSGEINSCDRLVVEGEVEVTLNDTLALEITSSGRFTGGCEVEEADISGIYEGDLTVRNTLFVRGTGRITGTIRYGQLELERGGQIAGNISVLGNDSISSSDAGKVRSAKAPLFGGGN